MEKQTFTVGSQKWHEMKLELAKLKFQRCMESNDIDGANTASALREYHERELANAIAWDKSKDTTTEREVIYHLLAIIDMIAANVGSTHAAKIAKDAIGYAAKKGFKP